jgi:hypothetical protein
VRNLFVPRDFPSREHLRIFSGSIANVDLYRIGSLEHFLLKTDLRRKLEELPDHHPQRGSRR